jgi:hypothetical protein
MSRLPNNVCGGALLNGLLSSIWTKFAHSFINDPIISGRINVKINKERINGYLYTP